MSTHTATRQQLDELDALLQKMLGTPATLPESSPPSEKAPASAAVPPAAKSQSQSFPPPADSQSSPPPPAPPRFPAPEIAFGVPPAAAFAASSQPPATDTKAHQSPTTWSIDLNPREGSSVLNRRQGRESPTETAGTTFLSVTTIPPSAAESAPPSAAVIPPSKEYHSTVVGDLHLLLRPIGWLSDRCDALLQALPGGHWLTTPTGRTLLGYVGLLLVAFSVASGAFAWFGWS